MRISRKLPEAICAATNRLFSLRRFATFTDEELDLVRERQHRIYGDMSFYEDDIRNCTNDEVRQHYEEILNFVVDANRFCSTWFAENSDVARRIPAAHHVLMDWSPLEETAIC